jgi:hypothetical protein
VNSVGETLLRWPLQDEHIGEPPGVRGEQRQRARHSKTNIVTPGFSPDEVGNIDDPLRRLHEAGGLNANLPGYTCCYWVRGPRQKRRNLWSANREKFKQNQGI